MASDGDRARQVLGVQYLLGVVILCLLLGACCGGLIFWLGGLAT